MFKRKCNVNLRLLKKYLFIIAFIFPLQVHASFIESTIGAAIVNDATAVFFNPAGLTLVKNPQIINLDSVAFFQNKFTGTAVQRMNGFTQSGTAHSETDYFLPSFYIAVPTGTPFTAGLGVVANDFNRDIQDNSILRYAQASNHIRDIDLVPAVGIKLNDYFAIGGNLNFSQANFLLEPISGLPSLNIPDSQSRNETKAKSVGGDFGVLIKPYKSTLLGFNYRSSIEYRMNGTSTFQNITADNYHFKFWTPARFVFSINHFFSKLGLIATVQHIEWDIFKNLHIFNIATQNGIVSQTVVPYHLHNTWLLTLGANYRITSKWIARLAATYNQKPSNGHFQISTGDSVVLGASMGYEINKYVTIDGSYAHAFIANQNIKIVTGRNLINGINEASRDAVSLKFIFNIC